MRWPIARKREGRYTVGLVNRANDCFANSNLQALGSLHSLYEYCLLLREVVPHPDMDNLYKHLVSKDQKAEQSTRRIDAIKSISDPLEVSMALRSEIVLLNEPVLEPKALDPWAFLRIVERFYNSKISRSQHDAHEMLHLILETLEIEHRRIHTFYSSLRKIAATQYQDKSLPANKQSRPKGKFDGLSPEAVTKIKNSIPPFPFKGSTRDQIVCSRCGYSPTGPASSFIVLSLIVPQTSRATLSELFSAYSKPEHIQDYGCTNCRLVELVRRLNRTINSPNTSEKARYENLNVLKYLEPYFKDPSSMPQKLEDILPKDVTSPISKATHFSVLPEILTIHLNRSIFWRDNASRNSCRVSIPEYLELFEEAERKEKVDANEKLRVSGQGRRKVQYTLVAIIRHKGTHNAGHYECFRRKNLRWWRSHLPMYNHIPSFEDVGTNSSGKGGNSSSSGSSSSNPSLGDSGDETSGVSAQVNGTDSKDMSLQTSSNSLEESSGHKQRSHNKRESGGFLDPLRIRRTRSQGRRSVSASTNGSPGLADPRSKKQHRHSASISWIPGFGTSLDGSSANGSSGSEPITAAPHSSNPLDSQPHFSAGESGRVTADKSSNGYHVTSPDPVTQVNQTHLETQGRVASSTAGNPPNFQPPSVDQEWWQISDEHSWERNAREVLKDESGAYLLFYERVSK